MRASSRHPAVSSAIGPLARRGSQESVQRRSHVHFRGRTARQCAQREAHSIPPTREGGGPILSRAVKPGSAIRLFIACLRQHDHEVLSAWNNLSSSPFGTFQAVRAARVASSAPASFLFGGYGVSVGSRGVSQVVAEIDAVRTDAASSLQSAGRVEAHLIRNPCKAWVKPSAPDELAGSLGARKEVESARFCAE